MSAQSVDVEPVVDPVHAAYANATDAMPCTRWRRSRVPMPAAASTGARARSRAGALVRGRAPISGAPSRVDR